ncbi:MAG: hypothetical protein NT062_37195 [Proteobacteria bacterium]|nr:hypothetical protein [Pseudomonadota bacterium]
MSEVDRSLLGWAMASGGLVVLCALALLVHATPIGGVHPAVKPLKFAVATTMMLGSLAVLLPRLSFASSVRLGLGWVLIACLVLELVPIVIQALRGRSSHFNRATPLDAALWNLMGTTIAVLTLAMIVVAILATVRPLRGLDALTTMAWRAGVWLFLLAAISGFGMGGRNAHSVGGSDGGAGMAVTQWSKTHGDLRVSHFFALHAFQLLPLLGYLLVALPIAPTARWAIMLVAIVAQAAVVVGTLVQAFAGRPLF